MAIESIKGNTLNQMSQQITVENAEKVTELTDKKVIPVKELQGSDSNATNSNAEQDEGRENANLSPDKIKNVLADINQRIRPTHTQCEFKYHEKTNRISITVRDSETDKVIREIPPEKTLDLIAKSLELAGILVDEKR